jgi:hypothetical protein
MRENLRVGRDCPGSNQSSWRAMLMMNFSAGQKIGMKPKKQAS